MYLLFQGGHIACLFKQSLQNDRYSYTEEKRSNSFLFSSRTQGRDSIFLLTDLPSQDIIT